MLFLAVFHSLLCLYIEYDLKLVFKLSIYIQILIYTIWSRAHNCLECAMYNKDVL